MNPRERWRGEGEGGRGRGGKERGGEGARFGRQQVYRVDY